MFRSASFDLIYAWKLFTRSLGNSLLCIVVVALSVGLSLFVYVVDYNIGLKPLPFKGSQNWLSLQVAKSASSSQRPNLDAYTYQELVKRSQTIDYLGAFSQRSPVLSDGQASTRLRGAAISPSLMKAMQAAPLYGRLFEDGDDRQGAASTIILSYDTWQNYFAADPQIVGKSVRIDGTAAIVIGVMPKDFFAFRDYELWQPLQLHTQKVPGDSSTILSAIVMPKAGQGEGAARRELQTIVDDINKTYPTNFSAKRQVAFFPASRMYTHDNIPVIAMATFIALVVLVLGGLNISMIFFAMLTERSREMALRKALGSDRWRVLRQCLLQSIFVIFFGLLLGSVLAMLGIHWAHGLLSFTARLQATGRDPNELIMSPSDFLVALFAALLLWLLSTLIPASRISRLDPAKILAGSGKGVAARVSNKTTTILVGVQVIVSCMLLVICANIAVAVNKELLKPIGISTEHEILSTYPTVFSQKYAGSDTRLQYWDQLSASIQRRIPGSQVAYMTTPPTSPSNELALIEDRTDTSEKSAFQLPVSTVSEQYFGMLDIKLLSGRLFESTDNINSQGVVVIDEVTATHYWPGRSPIGQRIRLNPVDSSPWLTIVGVVSRVSGPYSDTIGVVYRPLRQVAPESFDLLVKLPADSTDAREILRAAAFEVDPDLALHNLQALSEYMVAINSYKSMVPGFAGIGVITVILAASGLFGLISRSVSQRTQEIGILRALGSTRWRIIKRFMRQAFIYLGIGCVGTVVGVLLTAGMTSVIPNALGSVAPVTLLVLFIMVVVIFVSSYLPARYAVALEPGDALRHE